MGSNGKGATVMVELSFMPPWVSGPRLQDALGHRGNVVKFLVAGSDPRRYLGASAIVSIDVKELESEGLNSIGDLRDSFVEKISQLNNDTISKYQLDVKVKDLHAVEMKGVRDFTPVDDSNFSVVVVHLVTMSRMATCPFTARHIEDVKAHIKDKLPNPFDVSAGVIKIRTPKLYEDRKARGQDQGRFWAHPFYVVFPDAASAKDAVARELFSSPAFPADNPECVLHTNQREDMLPGDARVALFHELRSLGRSEHTVGGSTVTADDLCGMIYRADGQSTNEERSLALTWLVQESLEGPRNYIMPDQNNISSIIARPVAAREAYLLNEKNFLALIQLGDELQSRPGHHVKLPVHHSDGTSTLEEFDEERVHALAQSCMKDCLEQGSQRELMELYYYAIKAGGELMAKGVRVDPLEICMKVYRATPCQDASAKCDALLAIASIIRNSPDQEISLGEEGDIEAAATGTSVLREAQMVCQQRGAPDLAFADLCTGEKFVTIKSTRFTSADLEQRGTAKLDKLAERSQRALEKLHTE
eukprot:TRINITY_DN16894_c0_g1_i1.p1 TRINITY_DN16894_c0_g1~~TRINITY_DN16894_c0_g1_i1.p1  ORF type:complete len:589 (+),score=144.69 TRINITY_DN16894_c0_g1_i1:174-1769(+)